MSPSAVGMVADRDTAVDVLLREARAGDVVLVKASRGAQLDLVVEALVAAAHEGEARP
jgi:UDP-N-acetylmuramoyl-tripeptide--D-alanyl-D-alanine ligase